MRLFLAALAAAVLAACQAATPPAPKAPDYRLIDLTGTYTRIFDETANLPVEQRVAALKSGLVPQFPQFYRARSDRPDGETRFNNRLTASFAKFPEIRTKYEAVSKTFTGMIDGALVSFRKALPDMGPVGDVYLIHSLNEMDGGTRQIDGKTYFIFGADMIAQIHTPETQRPFFHHELFHIYHLQYFPECEPIWCGLWLEGLAVQASLELNPGSTDEQLLLTMPAPIRPAVDANFAGTVCFIRSKLDSTASEDYAQLFNFQRPNDQIPARSAYYVGMLVAAEARKTMSLSELAHLDVAHARPVLEAALDKLATCPS